MTPLIAGNWKMHTTRAEAAALARAVLRGLAAPLAGADVALYPPFPAIQAVAEVVAGSDIIVGAQNFYPSDSGAFTGEVSPPMLLDVGATSVLVGHSERRDVMGEDDALIQRKVAAALSHDILPVLCVGETLEQHEAGQTSTTVASQIRAGLEAVPEERRGDVTVAYEPVWAIGTGLTATPAQASEVHQEIRALLVELWGAAGQNIRILYGGSVKPANARELLEAAEIGGVLVGGASLKAESFCGIVRGAL